MIWLLLPQVQVDWAVQGEGLIRLLDGERPVYVREVRLVVEEGKPLRSTLGPALDPPVLIPTGTTALKVQSDGTIVATVSGLTREIGCVSLARFSPGQAAPVIGQPGSKGFGAIIEHAGAVLAPPVEKGAGLHIVGRLSAETRGDRVLLGEIAELSGTETLVTQAAELPVGAGPLPGGSRILTRGEVMVKLRAAGLATAATRVELPETIRVSRPSQEIPQAEIIQAARRALTDPVEAERLVPSVVARAVTAPVGQYVLMPGAPVRSGLGWSVPVAVQVDGRTAATVQVRFQQTTVAKPKTGMVKVGSQVTVVLQSGGLSVQTQGVLRSAGAVGDAVTVYVPSTKKMLSGELSDAGTVMVTL
ncbi:MAG: flagella basal body P-ring formation protein FlgA [Fimbriimonadia bacterium]|jgi:hypothetical protein